MVALSEWFVGGGAERRMWWEGRGGVGCHHQSESASDHNDEARIWASSGHN